MSSSLIQRIVGKACETFARKVNPGNGNSLERILSGDLFQTSLNDLKVLVNQLTAKDLGLQNCQALKFLPDTPLHYTDAPASYIRVFENRDVSIGIFIIHKRRCIPLHNHPNMFGLIKMLHGSIDLVHYTALNEETIRVENNFIFPVQKEVVCGVTPSHNSSLLTPDQGNFHKLLASNGSAAFLDILAPPYSRSEHDSVGDDKRECDFFEENMLMIEGTRKCFLKLIDPPDDYYCDSEPYLGPEIFI